MDLPLANEHSRRSGIARTVDIQRGNHANDLSALLFRMHCDQQKMSTILLNATVFPLPAKRLGSIEN